jgi:ferredoxin-thioredoxin reductase catalytic subunit
MKKYWRCFVCCDIHYGVKPPEICPTCLVKNAYVEVSSEEAERIMRPTKTSMTRAEFRKAIERFAEKNEFQVCSDEAKVETLFNGMFANEQNHGLKYCPCRLHTKDFAEDLKLVCPATSSFTRPIKGKKTENAGAGCL